MKKLFLILALAASVQVANAQGSKNPAAVKSAYEAAKVAADDAKKNTKVATWLKLGQASMDAYLAPIGNAWLGASKQDLSVVMGNEKPVSTEQVVVNGQNFTKETYANKNFYFGENGQLAAIEVTKPIIDAPLDKAFEAYKKAKEVDPKGTKAKDIATALTNIQQKYTEEAYNCYTLGKYSESSKYFEKAAEVSVENTGKVDAESVYNAGFTAWLAGDNDRAKVMFTKSMEAGYDGEGGEVYAKLADIAAKQGNEEESKNILEEGFSKYPQSQSILVGLINYYVSKGEDTGRLFELLNEAKKNEPTNASLYYVEGTIYEKLGDTESAIKSYDQCAVIDPNYEYGYIGKGVLYSKMADEILDKANSDNSLTQAQYDVQLEEYYKVLKSSVEPFEKAYEICKDPGVKSSIAAYLKNICFRFREESPEWLAKYEKYSAAAVEE